MRDWSSRGTPAFHRDQLPTAAESRSGEQGGPTSVPGSSARTTGDAGRGSPSRGIERAIVVRHSWSTSSARRSSSAAWEPLWSSASGALPRTTACQLRHVGVGMATQRSNHSPATCSADGATEPAVTNARTPSSRYRYQRTSPVTVTDLDASRRDTAEVSPSVAARTNCRRLPSPRIGISLRNRRPESASRSGSGRSAGSPSVQTAMPTPGRHRTWRGATERGRLAEGEGAESGGVGPLSCGSDGIEDRPPV